MGVPATTLYRFTSRKPDRKFPFSAVLGTMGHPKRPPTYKQTDSTISRPLNKCPSISGFHLLTGPPTEIPTESSDERGAKAEVRMCTRGFRRMYACTAASAFSPPLRHSGTQSPLLGLQIRTPAGVAQIYWYRTKSTFVVL